MFDIATGLFVVACHTKSPHHTHTYSAADSMEVDGSQGVDLPTLQERFSREITTLYLRVADSARQQSNYAVATRYLKLTESAIKEV